MTKLEYLKLAHKIQRRLLVITQQLEIAELIHQGDTMVSPEAAALIQGFDKATDNIAARIARLVASQTSLSADDKAAFQAEIDKLNLLGQDVNDPLPPSVST